VKNKNKINSTALEKFSQLGIVFAHPNSLTSIFVRSANGKLSYSLNFSCHLAAPHDDSVDHAVFRLVSLTSKTYSYSS